MPDENEEQILKQFNRALDDIIDRVFTKSQEILVEEGKVDTGQLLKSGNVNRSFLEKEIVYDAPYAAFVHEGTDPHSMPVKPLIGWAKRTFGVSGKEAERIAWAVRTKIKKEGTEPTRFLERALLEETAKGRVTLSKV